MSFSKRLKELREKKGLSQEALADKLKIPRTSVTHYESGDVSGTVRMPRQQRLNEIADFFGVSVDYLLGRTDTSEFSNPEKAFVDEVTDPNWSALSLELLRDKYDLTVDGKPATKEEIEGAIAFIRSWRNLKS